MPRVPYNADPSVAPVSGGPSLGSMPSPGEAFGESIAAATGQTGRVLEHAGDELMQRAVAMKQLQNESEAKEADANYMIAVGDKHAQFSSLKGKDAVAAYPQYSRDLQEMRTKFRDGLSNDMARKMFDSNSLSTMGRTIFNGAGHAATENKMYADGAAKARIEANQADAQINYKDDVNFERTQQQTIKEVRDRGVINGWDEATVSNNISKETSLAWFKRLQAMARTEPNRANDLLEKNRDKLGNHLYETETRVRSQLHDVGARNISEAVNQGYAPYMTPGQISRATGVNDALLAVFKEAQRAHPELKFTIGGQGGRRTAEEQAALVAAGRSKTYNSDHMDGKALDTVPLDANGRENYEDREAYGKIAAAMDEASKKLGIPLQPKSKAFTNWDPGHHALPKDFDTASVDVPDEPIQSRIDRAKDWSRKTAPEDGVYTDKVEQRVLTDYTRQHTIDRNTGWENRLTVEEAIAGNYGDKKPTTIEELKATDPKVAAAWDALEQPKKNAIYKTLVTNAKEDFRWDVGGERLRRYNQLMSMADNDPIALMDVNVSAEKMPDSAKKELMAQQRKIMKGSSGDAAMQKSMSDLRPILGPADLATRTANNKDRYDEFYGAFKDAIKDYTVENKKPPGAKEREVIAARLLQQQTVPRLFGLINGKDDPLFEAAVPSADVERITNLPGWKELGIEPSEGQIKRYYVREQYKKLYGNKPMAKAAP